MHATIGPGQAAALPSPTLPSTRRLAHTRAHTHVLTLLHTLLHAVLIASIIIFLLAACIAPLILPRSENGPGKTQMLAGLMALFVTMGDDIGTGLPVMSAMPFNLVTHVGFKPARPQP